MSHTAKFVREITVEDPDTKGVIHLAVYKHQNGGMFAMDSSFIDQEAEEVEENVSAITDPFSPVLNFMDKSTLYLTEK
jgi:hypothetical protein